MFVYDTEATVAIEHISYEVVQERAGMKMRHAGGDESAPAMSLEKIPTMTVSLVVTYALREEEHVEGRRPHGDKLPSKKDRLVDGDCGCVASRSHL